MDKKIRIIIASAMLISVIVFIIVLYVASAVMHKIPEKIAIILGAAVAITDLSMAFYFLNKPSKPNNPQ